MLPERIFAFFFLKDIRSSIFIYFLFWQLRLKILCLGDSDLVLESFKRKREQRELDKRIERDREERVSRDRDRERKQAERELREEKRREKEREVQLIHERIQEATARRKEKETAEAKAAAKRKEKEAAETAQDEIRKKMMEAQKKIEMEEKAKRQNDIMNKAKRRFVELPTIQPSLPPPGPGMPAAGATPFRSGPPPPPSLKQILSVRPMPNRDTLVQVNSMINELQAGVRGLKPGSRARSKSKTSERQDLISRDRSSEARTTTARRSRSPVRRSRSPARRRSRSPIRRRSRSPIRRRSRSPVRMRSRSPGRRRSRSPVRRRSRSPARRRSNSRVRRRSRTKSPARRTRSPARRRSRSRSRSKRRTRRTRSRSRSKSNRRGRTPVDSRSRKTRTRTRSRSRNIDSIMKHLDPNIPCFLQHPADRMVGDKSKKGKRKRDDGDTDTHKVREESLEILKKMGMTGKGPDTNNTLILALEVEILWDEEYKQFTQLGAAITDGKQASFFRSIIPRYMEGYNKNLILKNQNNLLSSLGMKYDEELKRYLFTHKKKGEDVEPVTEEKALTDILGFIRSYCRETKCVVFMHSMETFLPLLLAKLNFYKLSEDFEEKISGFCDFSTLMSRLNLSVVCKNAKFQDLMDVYKQVIGKAWPKEVSHKDGIASLSDNCVKKLISEISVYLEKNNLTLLKEEFFQACGFKNFSVVRKELDTEKLKDQCSQNVTGENTKSVELLPSDRPGEVTIVTLKRFECIDVMDLDEVEEEGIEEDQYFQAETVSSSLVEDVTIKPGFVVTVTMNIGELDENLKYGNHVLVAKNASFADESYCKDKEGEEERLKNAAKCEIARQIVGMIDPQTEVETPETKKHSKIQVKILNPLDIDVMFKCGDLVAVVRMEKPEDPDDPDFRSYTVVKNEKDIENAKRQDDLVRSKSEDRTLKSKKKKRKHSKKKKDGNKKKKEVKTPGDLSFDFDALDFELEDVDEESELEEDELNGMAPMTPSQMSEVSLSDMSDTEETGDNNKPTEKINGSDKSEQKFNTEPSNGIEKEKVSEPAVAEEPTIPENINLDQTDFYDTPFYGLLNQIGGGINLPAGAQSMCVIKLKPFKGFRSFHMIGRKCCISLNEDYTAPSKLNLWKTKNFNILPRIATVFKSSENFAIVNAFVQNVTDKPVFYPNEIALATVRFISPTPRNPVDVGLLNLPDVQEDTGADIAPPGEEIVNLPNPVPVIKTIPSSFVTDSEPPPPGEIDLVLNSPVKNNGASYVQQPEAEPEQLPPVPTQDEIFKLTVKTLKSILTENNLNTSGLKTDLVKRVEEYYTKNPKQIDRQIFQSALSVEIPVQVFSTPKRAASNVNEELENFEGSPSSVYFKEPVPNSPALQASTVYISKPAVLTTISESAGPKSADPISKPESTEPFKTEFSDKLANKKAESKAFDSLEISFHDKWHFIDLKSAVTVEKLGETLLTVRLSEIEIFMNDLVDRKVLVRRDNPSPKIKRQICKLNIDGRSPVVEIIIDSDTKDISAQEKFFKLKIEKFEKDVPDQFFLPHNDVFDDVSKEIFNMNAPAVATTLVDVVLPPKAFHTEICHVDLKPEDMEIIGTKDVILERTSDHGMNIGMRKMILVPKILSVVRVENGEAKVEVKIYNASRQRLRISKKTNIAKVFLCRNTNLTSKVGI